MLIDSVFVLHQLVLNGKALAEGGLCKAGWSQEGVREHAHMLMCDHAQHVYACTQAHAHTDTEARIQARARARTR